ncbi:LysR family transcriptional regulator [Novibacillus thermophilus]|jgi:DNA-binding transcriptional LysR family regulator|uniref:LysR family transcriptional regulator n=1 Tax=Novibacillus thermophilus TaxID=1471761 RepID=A0A1U9K4C1_9BACL|nr:LysR family transcriptional regulator [Novibacillus thermophilus]AQS54870.1 LysR family transcriptional regulator [Novibacillus thermophilus]
METRLLKYACEVYRKQSFTQAAKALNIAQPSLSQQIAKLERDLGVRLFFRDRNKVTPTPEGIRFFKRAEHILQLHEDLEREMREQSEGATGDLIIGTTVITGGHVLPPLLQSYQVQYPQVTVRLVEESTETITELTVKGHVDVSILSLPVEDSRLTTKTMLTEPLFLALPTTDEAWLPEGLTRQTPSVRLEELAGAPFILLKRGYGFRQTVLGLCAESGFQPRVAYETSSIQTALSFVKHGLGVTLVPEMVARNNIGPVYLSLASKPTRTLVFAYHKDRYLPNAARSFLDLYDRVTQESKRH